MPDRAPIFLISHLLPSWLWATLGPCANTKSSAAARTPCGAANLASTYDRADDSIRNIIQLLLLNAPVDLLAGQHKSVLWIEDGTRRIGDYDGRMIDPKERSACQEDDILVTAYCGPQR